MNNQTTCWMAAMRDIHAFTAVHMTPAKGRVYPQINPFLQVCIVAILFFGFFISGASAAEHIVAPSGGEFTEIQAAIAWAMPGDTITVESGEYRENIRIDKKITLAGIDSGDGLPVIDAGNKGNGIEILAGGSTVSGFEIENCDPASAIRVSSNGNTIKNNVLKDNARGIYLVSAGTNSLTGNTITESTVAGIILEDAASNTIEGNSVTRNAVGIVLDERSVSNTIYHNTFSNTQNVASKSTTSVWNTVPVLSYSYLGRTVESRMGNYWSDYRGKDQNGDGIGDTEYVIVLGANKKAALPVNKNVFDSFPLMDPREYYTNLTTVTHPATTNRPAATPSVKPAAANVTAGQPVMTPGAPGPETPQVSQPRQPANPPEAPGWFSLPMAGLAALLLLLGGAGLFLALRRTKKPVTRHTDAEPPAPVAKQTIPLADSTVAMPTADDLSLADIEESMPVSGEQKYYFPKELENKYSGIHYIGRGGVAYVYSAIRKSDYKRVAVKIPISFDEVTGKCFLNEINAWEKLRHPNIVEVLAVNILPVPYVEMEYVPGTLEMVEKPLPVWKAVHLVTGIADALKYAHAHGFIHRDIKPHNILVTEDLMPKITDWGMSKVMATEMKKSSVTGFSLSYAAPEQVSPGEFGRTDARTDIYQLGVLFYELVTGSIPFGGDSIVEVGNAIVREKPLPPSEYTPDAAAVEKIILKCLEKKPQDRYQSASELLDALSGYLDEDDE